ncbi:MAG: YggS family pyridoxal phosphate-dependent enzyme [Weeksellaceae bacterium]|nr:YggS family pyridoxal phosphate-dependent enzyme [Weeksellaceae bacterium]
MQQERYNALLQSIPAHCKLIAVSKTKSVQDIQALYKLGQRDFGENKVQELLGKKDHLPADVRWHMIGNLQRNKVKYLTDFIHLIHSVESSKLLKEISKQAVKSNNNIAVLLQVKIAREESKEGMSVTELEPLLQDFDNGKYPNIIIKGLMGMATFTEDEAIVSEEFARLREIRDGLQQAHPYLEELSMGMSGDYSLAIEQGSTMLRIGSLLFGARDY